MRRSVSLRLLVIAGAWLAPPLARSAEGDDAPRLSIEDVFPPDPIQTHAPSIVECRDGGLLASWYGDREGSEDDSAIFGARRAPGADRWTEPFLLADTPGFPDGNTSMAVAPDGRLWLFWPTIIGGSWESCLLNVRVSSDFDGSGPPSWEREGVLLLRPADFRDEALALLGDRDLRPPRGAIVGPGGQREKLADPLYQRLGWANRCKPTFLPGGRIVLPLYSDTFSISIMAISDDGGASWRASRPLLGFGNIQPTVLRRDDGSLVAYMRENGPIDRIRVAESQDGGETWGPIGETELPNPGSGIDAVRLASGRWLLVYNDDATSRARLAVSVSDDEGRSWSPPRFLERHEAGRYQYPAVIQARDGTIHVIYSCFIAAEPGDPGFDPEARNQFIARTIRHASFPESWALTRD
ncbi:sialidase family protein [Tautonia sociabilis]|uniref:Neuraminidase (Sialidase)-like protein n=1 Tax=Tautonia sociabilis TaxID=2080755 RepID=A0A432MEV8_9BACT|nr:sialidase family protein [Tautonia sociabilis]RUL84216.1 neuraminidase (sialidase)-like protein [Tautonia sociabilis]